MGVLVAVHIAAAVATALAVAALAVVVIWGRVRGRSMPFATDRSILGVLAAVTVAVLLGLALLVTSAGPRDALHLLYAGVALVTLPVARFAVPALAAPRRAWLLLAGCVVMAGLLVRLAQTG